MANESGIGQTESAKATWQKCVETAEKKIVAEGNRFRAYVLVALPTGDANILKKAKEQA